jgi:hypothetical protein
MLAHRRKIMTTPPATSKIVQKKLVRRGPLLGNGEAGQGVYGTHNGKSFVTMDDVEAGFEFDLGLNAPAEARTFLDIGSAEGPQTDESI